MLEVGNGGMTNDEYIAHFSLWCLIKSPLLIGCDVTKMSAETVAILTNTEVIALNQDPMGVQGHVVAHSSDNNLQVYAAPLANGDIGVVLLNRGDSASNITVNWSDIGLNAGVGATVRDLWSHSSIGMFTNSFSLRAVSHGSRTVRVIPLQQ